MNTRISVIVPVYNVEKYLPRCIDSLRNQTYKNLEIILVDDGSPDNCPALCDLAQRSPFVTVIHKENGGVMSARCAGIAAATGEWIGFVDGDDYVEPDMYEFLYDLAQRTGADIAQCGFDSVDETGKHLGSTASQQLVMCDGRDAIRRVLRGSMSYSVLCTKIYRRSLFESQQLDFGLRASEDQLANYYLFRRAQKVVSHDVEKYHYRHRPGSALHSQYSAYRLVDQEHCLQQIMAEEKDSDLQLDVQAAKIVCCLTHAMYILHTNRNQEYYDDLMREVKSNWRFILKYPSLFRREDKIKAVLLCLNKRVAKYVYGLHRKRHEWKSTDDCG